MEAQEEKKNSSLKTIITILIAVLLIIATGLGVWYWQQGEIRKQKSDADTKITAAEKQVKDAKQKADEDAKDAATKAKEAKASSWKTYVNNQDGFQLTFLDTWKGYAITENLSDDHTTKYIGFGLPSTKTCDVCEWGFDKNYNNLFTISVYTKNAWAVASSEEGPKPTKIGEKGDKVFAYMHGNGIPMVSVANPYDDANEIVKTFKILE